MSKFMKWIELAPVFACAGRSKFGMEAIIFSSI